MTELLQQYNWEGVIVGLSTFLIIGIFHPLVIKGEYYFGKKCRWWFLIAGIGFLLLALSLEHLVGASLAGVTAFSCFWSIKEVNEQVERVRKGWFPANPRRQQTDGEAAGKRKQ